MPRSDPPDRSGPPDTGDGGIVTPLPEPLGSVPGSSPELPAPAERVDSWDPIDDETKANGRRQAQGNWSRRPSWGRKAVAAFPVVAVALAVGLIAYTTASAQGAIDQVQSVTGSGGATLLLSAPPQVDNGPSTSAGQASDYNDVTFTQPSGASRPIQGSTSLALPPYVGWEANGSAGADNGFATVSGGLLHVGVRRATPEFKGWFLTASNATPATCTFQFSAASPPPVTVSTPDAVGELVMAVQTSDTVTTGDINYVVVSEIVGANGQRSLIAGYSTGHLSRATEHVLKRVPWAPGPLDVAVQTNGDNQLSVWVDGSPFLDETGLDMGIAPPFEPYLEVQARNTPYTVAFTGYSSVCQSDIAISDLPDHTVATLGNESVTAHGGQAVFPRATSAPPVTGVLKLSLPGTARPVTFADHTYWPGDRLSFEQGS